MVGLGFDKKVTFKFWNRSLTKVAAIVKIVWIHVRETLAQSGFFAVPRVPAVRDRSDSERQVWTKQLVF